MGCEHSGVFLSSAEVVQWWRNKTDSDLPGKIIKAISHGEYCRVSVKFPCKSHLPPSLLRMVNKPTT